MKLATGQIRVVGGEPDRNLDRAVAAIHGAAKSGADLILLPECLDLGWTHPSAKSLARPIPGERSDLLCRAAAEAGIAVVAGLTELDEGRIRNTAIFVTRTGAIASRHRKINILDIAADIYEPGRQLDVFETEFGPVALAICADCLPESIHIPLALARIGARLILSPCAWAVPAGYDEQRDPYGGEWLASYSEVASTYGITIAGVSSVGSVTGGPWDGYSCIGKSLVCGPQGEIYRGPYGADADVVDIVQIPRGKDHGEANE